MKSQQRATGLSISTGLVWITAFAFVLAGLGSLGILDNNEGLYAEVSREMLASHDWHQWIIPHLNGLPYMEKPPMLYWLTALSFAVFGISEWSARVVPAISALACVATLLQFGRAIGRPQTGRLAALIFVSGIGVATMSRLLMFDMLLTALLSMALTCAYHYLHDRQAKWLRLAYACLALTSLTKGSVASVLFALIIVSFMLASRRLRDWRLMFEPYAILIYFAIALPWHVLASQVEPAFSWFYFYNEHILRFLGLREPRDYYSGPWWYYLPRMLLYLFPWSFLISGFCFSVQQPASAGTVSLQRFLLLAWLLPLLFFSASSAKANYYLIAAVPFAAFHLALAIEKRNFPSGARAAIPALLIGLLAIGCCFWLSANFKDPWPGASILGMKTHAFALAVLAGLALLAMAIAYAAWRNARAGLLCYLVLPAWLAAAAMAAMLEIEPLVSSRLLAAYLQRELPDRDIYLYRDFEKISSLAFYLKKPIPVVESHSNDLFWGDRLHDNDIVISEDQFKLRLPGNAVAIVVIDQQILDFKESSYYHDFRPAQRIGKTFVFINLRQGQTQQQEPVAPVVFSNARCIRRFSHSCLVTHPDKLP